LPKHPPRLFASSVAHHRRHDLPVGPRRASGRRREHRAPPAGPRAQPHRRLHPSLLHRELHLLGSGLRAEAPPGLLPLPHLHPHVPDRHHVRESLSNSLGSFNPVGLFLDQTGSRPGSRHSWCDLSADSLHATRQEPSFASSSLLFKSSGRVHVSLYHVTTPGSVKICQTKSLLADSCLWRSWSTVW
jgi:hypothetical protein